MKKIKINTQIQPYEMMSTMGCRTQNAADLFAIEDYKKNIDSIISGGNLVSNIYSAAQKDGRGNLAPTTIILPTIAMEAKLKFEELRKEYDYSLEEIFFDMLDETIYDAKDSLIERYEWLCSQPPEAARFMYENGLMAGYDGENIESALKHGTLAIGQLGLAEALQLLIGCNHTTKTGMKFAHKIEQLFNSRCKEFKETYKLNFGVYYSPAENLCHTAMKKFKAKYGEIPNVSDREYFTNSMHIPVWEQMSVFDKINLESELTGYSNAGCITYVEFDSSAKNNLEALETIVKYAMDKDIPYFAINVPNDTCMSCGYTDDLNDECTQCGGQEIQRLRRVTGYLTGNYTTAFNKGKQHEVEDRITHSNFTSTEN